MSLLASLAPAEGAKHYSKRIGRGIGSGMGGTSTKGHKGQLARTGGRVRRGFEGGQTPLARRLPKFGFSNHKFAAQVEIVTLAQLSKFTGVVTPVELVAAGLVHADSQVKVLATGQLTSPVTVKAHAFSKGAQEAIAKAGGSVEVIK